MASFISKKDDFGHSRIRPVNSEDLSKFKGHKYSQPLPGASDSQVIDWATRLVRESYNYKKDFHERWYKNALDYFTIPSFDSKQRSGRNVAVDIDQDTEVMVPALVKRYVDLGAMWLTREIFKSEPFMQFTNYEQDDDIRKAQKLYERKMQGDTETFGAREKSCNITTDLFLYGNSVAKAQFTQDRIVTMEVPELQINTEDEEDYTSVMDLDSDDPMSGVNITMDDPYPMHSIIDQYAEFKSVYLGHFIIDPIPSNRDWRKARYMGDIEYLTAEEIMERFNGIRGFKSKFERITTTSADYTQFPLVGTSDSFLKAWCQFTEVGKEITQLAERQVHSVTYLYTRYTETCIIDNSLVVYHQYRARDVVKAGAFPYVMFKMPSTSGGLFSTGYGHILRTLQLEQIILASKRLQSIEDMNGFILQYVGGAVDDIDIKNIDNLKVISVEQAGAIQEMVPNHQAMAGFLDAEARNFQRAEQYAGIPSILDSSNTKTHLGAVPQRMEAAQVQFDVILDNVRDGFKELFQKMHVFNMAYLEGDIPIKGSTGPFDKDFDDNVLDATELMLLANQPELSIQLNLGIDVGADKLKSFAAVINTAPVANALQQLQQSGALGSEKMMQLVGMLFDLAGLTEFRPIFEMDPMALQQQQMAMQQQQMGMPGQPGPGEGAPPQGGMPPQQPMM